MADKFTDIITYVLSLSLAAGVIAFAAYKVVVLNGMENPPANLGLNFPAPKRKVIMDASSADDNVQNLSHFSKRAASFRLKEERSHEGRERR